MLLRRGDDQILLRWIEEGGDRRRAVPAGEWRLITVRVERSHEGEPWFLSSTGPGKRALRIEAGETRTLELPAKVVFEGKALGLEGELHLRFGVFAADGRGQSIYRAGRRVPVRYALLDERGEVLAGGVCGYG